MAFLDWFVLIIYAGVVIGLGYYVGRKERNLDDYFLGGRSMSWIAVMISIYATAASALTFIGVPGAAFGGDFVYLQLAIGDLVGRILIAWLLLTVYYKGGVTSIYEFLGQRFGPRTRDAGTGFFILTRILASGVRLAGCAIALHVVFNLPLKTAVLLIALAAVVYTTMGGIKAVIYTDGLQFFLFIGGALLTLFAIWHALPGGFSQFLSMGAEHGKFQVLHFSLDPSHPDFFLNLNSGNALAAGLLFGCFTTFAVLGTDQGMVQRMLTCDSVRKGQKALVWTAIMNFPITLLFLSVGAALFVYYRVLPDEAVNGFIEIKRNDFIFPHFIKTVLGPGVRGLLIAGLLAASMSSLDSALNALASTTYVDIIRRYFRPSETDAQALKTSRLLVVGFAVILALVGMLFGDTESILWLGFRIFGYTYGAMVGIFLLAVLTKNRGTDWANVGIMISSVLLVIFFTADSVGFLAGLRSFLLSPLGIEKIAWKWTIVLGSIWTFGIAALFRPSGQVRSENHS